MGFRPGPVFREILQAVEEAQLEGSLIKRQDALDFVRRQYQKAG
jgi:hypothetical protein